MTATQTVQLFPDEPMTGVQRVIYDPAENWLTIFHNGYEISLHECNFLRLAALVDEVRNKISNG